MYNIHVCVPLEDYEDVMAYIRDWMNFSEAKNGLSRKIVGSAAFR